MRILVRFIFVFFIMINFCYAESDIKYIDKDGAIEEITIKKFRSGQYQAWKNDQVLCWTFDGEWNDKHHEYGSYTYFKSINDIRELLSEMNDRNVCIKEKEYNQLYFLNDLGTEIQITSTQTTSTDDILIEVPGHIENIMQYNDELTMDEIQEIYKGDNKMNFILSVFGANVVIIFSILFYIIGFLVIFKNYNIENYNDFIETNEFFINIDPNHFFVSLLWPITVPIWIFIKIIGIIIPEFIKISNKFIPTIEINKEKE